MLGEGKWKKCRKMGEGREKVVGLKEDGGEKVMDEGKKGIEGRREGEEG